MTVGFGEANNPDGKKLFFKQILPNLGMNLSYEDVLTLKEKDLSILSWKGCLAWLPSCGLGAWLTFNTHPDHPGINFNKMSSELSALYKISPSLTWAGQLWSKIVYDGRRMTGFKTGA